MAHKGLGVYLGQSFHDVVLYTLNAAAIFFQCHPYIWSTTVLHNMVFLYILRYSKVVVTPKFKMYNVYSQRQEQCTYIPVTIFDVKYFAYHKCTCS